MYTDTQEKTFVPADSRTVEELLEYLGELRGAMQTKRTHLPSIRMHFKEPC